MPPPDRPTPPKVSPNTLGRMAEEIVRLPLNDKSRQAVANLLPSLLADMAALYALDLGENELATLYDPAEAES